MRYFTLLALTFFLGIGIIAQETCSVFVQDALEAVQDICDDLERNEICYGNARVSVASISDDLLDFENPGDVISILDIEAIRTSAFSELEEWGIALMAIQANVPDTLPGQNVNFLIFGDVELHTDVDEDSEEHTPMQAIYLTPGIGQINCNEVPDAGILIQTPEVDQSIELIINDTEIQLGSTIYLQISTVMTIYVLEGQALVTHHGLTVFVPEGTLTQILLDDNGRASNVPGFPSPYQMDDFPGLPLNLLPINIVPAPPFSAPADLDYTVIIDGRYCPVVIPSGTYVVLAVGSGYDTEAEALEAFAEDFSAILIDGVAVSPVTRNYDGFVGPYFNYSTIYEWGRPAPGIYQISGVEQNLTHSCEVTIVD